jgi:Fis family transcriptional regulator
MSGASRTAATRRSGSRSAPQRVAKEETPPRQKEALNGSDAHKGNHSGGTLHETVTACVRQYLQEIDGEPTTDFYQLVLSQVEPPLLREVMSYTRHNQTRAAQMLGLNRGTLRKKLRQYDISSDSQ